MCITSCESGGPATGSSLIRSGAMLRCPRVRSMASSRRGVKLTYQSVDQSADGISRRIPKNAGVKAQKWRNALASETLWVSTPHLGLPQPIFSLSEGTRDSGDAMEGLSSRRQCHRVSFRKLGTFCFRNYRQRYTLLWAGGQVALASQLTVGGLRTQTHRATRDRISGERKCRRGRGIP